MNGQEIHTQSEANEGKTITPQKNRSGNRGVGGKDESRKEQLRKQQPRRRARRIAESLKNIEGQKAIRRAEILARADGIRRSADLV